MNLREPVRTALIAVAVVTGAVLAWQLASVLLLVFAAILFAILLNAGAELILARLHLSRGPAVAAVLAVAGLVIAALIWGAAPGIIEQAGTLSDTLPQAFQSGLDQLQAKPWGKRIVEHVSRWQEWTGPRSDWLSRAGSVFGGIAGAVAALLVTFFVGLYLSLDPGTYRRGVVRLFPVDRRDVMDGVLGEMAEKLKWWLLGRLLMMAFVAVFTWTGLAFLDIPLALTLAVIAGLLDFIQNIGPFLAAVPALVLAIPHGPVAVLWVAILYTVVQLAENYVLGPIVQRRTADIPPALLIPGQLAFGLLLGAGGLILAAPIIAAGLVAVRRLYIEQGLESASRTRTPA